MDMGSVSLDAPMEPMERLVEPEATVSNPHSGDATSVADPSNASDLTKSNDDDPDAILRKRTLRLGEVPSSQEDQPADDERMTESVLPASVPNPGSEEHESTKVDDDPYDAVASDQHDGEEAANNQHQKVPEKTHDDGHPPFDAMEHQETLISILSIPYHSWLCP